MRSLRTIFAIAATGVALFVAGCNPLELDEPPALAGDFSDPMYPKTYGRLSVDLSIDASAAASEAGKSDVKELYLEFFFKNSDGNYVLCKEYEKYSDMPPVVLFPIGEYKVVARTKEYNTDREYFRGETTMNVTATSTVMGQLVCLLLADEFADPIYPKVYGQVAVDLSLQLGTLFDRPSNIETPNANKMMLSFYFKAPDGTWILCKHYKRSTDLPIGVSFPVGDYRVAAHSHNAMSDIMSEPYVYGEAQYVVSQGNQAKPSVKGSVRNAWVEIQPTDNFLTAVHTWSATVRQQSEAAPEVRLTKDSTRVRFVRPGLWNVAVEGKQKGDNLPVSYINPFGALAGGDRADAVLDAVASGELTWQIQVKYTITRRDHNIFFPDNEGELAGGGYKPEGPSEEPEPVPVIEGDGFDVDQIKVLTRSDFEGPDNDLTLKYSLKVVAIAATGGIQNFEITIKSTHEMLSPAMIISLFDGETFDLANVPSGSNLETNLNNFGILPKGTEIKGDYSFTFDLTRFMSLLPVHTEPHNFILKVTDGKGRSTEKTVRIHRES